MKIANILNFVLLLCIIFSQKLKILSDSKSDFTIRVRVKDGPELDFIKNSTLRPDSDFEGYPTLNLTFTLKFLFPLKL